MGSAADQDGNLVPRILIVDDEIRSIRAMTAKLERLGVDLVTANSVNEAMKIINGSDPIDGFITDIMMDPAGLPSGQVAETQGGFRTGIKLAEIVKEAMPGIPIVGVSAARYPFDDDKTPFDAFVSKQSMLKDSNLWSNFHENFIARRLDRPNDWVRETLEQEEMVIYESKPDFFGLDHKEFLEQREQIQVAVNENILRVLNGDMDRLPLLSAREFEQICALVLEREGYGVTISTQGPDGGIDLIATSNDSIMRPVYLVQCKRNRIDRKVSVPILRDLRSVVDERRANGGIVMTSSFFTSTAERYADSYQYQLKLIDVLRLKSIIDGQS